MSRNNGAIKMIFAGGGTGGHLFPALAIADGISARLQEKGGAEIRFVGTEKGIEYRLKDTLGYPLDIINVRGLARSLTLKNLMVPFILFGALIRAAVLLSRFRPDMVVGTGGYAALPVLLVSQWAGILTVLQEQNSYPGITTRQLAGRAKRIYLGFEGARELIRTKGKIILTGNPVRNTVGYGSRDEGLKQFGLDSNKKTIFISGGSQGAHALNTAVLSALDQGGLSDGYQLLWQTGKRDYTEVTAKAGNKVSPRSLFPFTERMDLAYAVADLAICRAGALTLAELAAQRLPAILIPFPHAAGNHQHHNAEDYASDGGAEVIDEQDLAGIDLLSVARKIIESGGSAEMKSKLENKMADQPAAVDLIVNDIIELLKDSGKDIN